MSRCSASAILISTLTLCVACGIAHAAALVAPTTHATQPASVPPVNDAVKEQYRRPDMIPFPAADPYTPEKAALGRVLFYDKRLSAAGTHACASCHDPGFDYGDGLARAVGAGTIELARRSPSIMNSAWGDLYTWDGGAASLEEQVLEPIAAPAEMNRPLGGMIQMLAGIPGYAPLFSAAFPGGEITPNTVAAAIATFERTVVSAEAPFDAWIAGDETAIPEPAKRGFDLFNAKAGCAGCHAGWRFTDDGFHDIGLPDKDLGRGVQFPHVDKLQHAFKTPGLRETARRGPYMHNGSLPTLEAVVAHYNRGGAGRTSQSELVKPLDLSEQEQADIVAFLFTLTSVVKPDFIPGFPR